MSRSAIRMVGIKLQLESTGSYPKKVILNETARIAHEL